MSTEENKAAFRRYIEALNKQDLAVALESCAPDYVWHGARRYGVSPDLAGLKQLLTAAMTAFPDAHHVVEDLIAEGDKVVARVTTRGTHRGEIMGIPPTGKRVSWTWIEIDRIADDRIVECWDNSDDLGLMQQLGAIPQMTQAGA
jgi:steroid delta-isomerase-like uncharacterized protein